MSGSAERRPQFIAGCMYRVLQTTGPDGKNLLKLLPISKPSGSFVPLVQAPAMPNSPAGNISTPVHLTFKTQLGSSAAPSSVKIFQSPNPGKIILTRMLDKQEGVRADSEKEGLVPGASVQGRGSVQDMAVPGSSPQSGTAYMVVNTNPLPAQNPGKPPVLPSGHHLQIPADAEVKSVPASLLPPAIQQKILAAAATSASDGSKMPTVIYVSPVNTVRTPQALSKRMQALCPRSSPEAPRALLLAAAPEGAGAGPAEGPRRRQAPMKWIVQEATPLTQCLIPVKSSNNVASKILKTLSDARNLGMSSANVLPLCPSGPGASQAKLTPLKDNALVMYNGKVYLLAKRGSDILAAQAERQTPSSPEPSLRKETPQRVDSSAVNQITSQVVNLVLSKSRGLLLAQTDPNPRADPQHSSPNDSRAAPVAPVPAGAAQQDPGAIQGHPCPAPPMGDTPGPAGGAQGHHGRDRSHPLPRAAGAVSPQGEQERAHSADRPKIQGEHMDSLGELETQPPKQPHWKQYLELRKKFGLTKEERVYLRRIPLIQDSWENPEERGCSSASLERRSNSCSSSSLDVEIGNCLQEYVPEEKIIADPEEDLTRKRKIRSSPLSDSGKRRRNSSRSSTSPSSETTNALPRSVSPPPASPEPSIPTGSSGASQGRASEPGTPPAGSAGTDSEIPELVAPGGAPSLLEGSFRDDAFPAAPPDLDETIRDEKIKRLKQLLREREAALEEMRREMQQS
ncbi:ligand-dependent nuclear receptor-interacting factor 1 isoform X1 [Manacus candei]|uniref:ligand-dependent nuclear receptor-interacting factor 1 isoform X1 n=2 Tax=Manacus candei TaxID=415023 RepID=UPI0022268ECD|nr:ligand-dependent nuclear receptor-interacting factor 1 isoform X1 [Manacus candei]